MQPRPVDRPTVAPLLKRAFETRGAKAVALSLNSPGGSPVQSALIAQRIQDACRRRRSLPVIAFVEDVAASGGYWLACAADEIIADPSSIVGSIGVISSGFGFQDLIARHRRGTARPYVGRDASRCSIPSGPSSPKTSCALKRLQAEIHDGFKDWIRQRRGKLLKGDESMLFNWRVLDRPGAASNSA